MQEESPTSSSTAVGSDSISATSTPHPIASSRPIIRRSHRKSRAGCQNCKARRIKCDESKPGCRNCVKRSMHCDYLVEALDTTHLETTTNPAGTFSASVGLNVSDIELTYYWTTLTSQTLSAGQSSATFWRTNVTELSFSSPHSLHLILAFTALHLAFSRPARRQEYLKIADRHYSHAVPLLTNELANVNPENCDAVYVSVQMMCFIAWARGPKAGEYLAFSTIGQSDWLIMFRGVRSTLESIGRGNFTKTHEPSLRSKGVPLSVSGRSDFDAPLKELRDHIPHITLDEQHRHDDLESLEILVECYLNRYGGVDGEYHVVFSWLFRMGDAFLLRLQQHSPIPILIYAYFTVLLNDMECFWYMKGWTHHIMSGIYGVLTDEHRVWLRWPMAQVGWIPP